MATQKELITQRLNEDPEFLIKALLWLTDDDDQRAGVDGVGASSYDSGFLNSCSAQYHRRGTLSEKQMAALRDCLRHYWQQFRFLLVEAPSVPKNQTTKKNSPSSPFEPYGD